MIHDLARDLAVYPTTGTAFSAFEKTPFAGTCTSSTVSIADVTTYAEHLLAVWLPGRQEKHQGPEGTALNNSPSLGKGGGTKSVLQAHARCCRQRIQEWR